MQVIDTSLDEVKLIQPRLFRDHRGFFLETFEKQRYQELLHIDEDFVQDNHSRSYQHVLRGLHLQYPHGQGKLVHVIRGEIFDVAVDVRPHSASFGQWTSAILNEENQHQLWIPQGFAHGFVVLSDIAELAYKCTNYYHPESELCLKWDDSDLNIPWPVQNPILSEKDQQGMSLQDIRQKITCTDRIRG